MSHVYAKRVINYNFLENKNMVKTMVETISEKITAQKTYCETNGLPMFAPTNCYFCHRNIYEQISLKKASSELITGCPYCHRSYID